jgi:RteC protein
LIKQISKIFNDFIDEINVLEKEHQDIINKAEKGIDISQSKLQILRNIISSNQNLQVQEEIYFFKKVKPIICSKLMYYVMLIEIETKRPVGSLKKRLKFLDQEVIKAQKYLHDNNEFYQYYRKGGTQLDSKYFVRNKNNTNLNLNNLYFLSDKEFHTSHDTVLAMIIAKKMFISFLQNEIHEIENSFYKNTTKETIVPNISWTAHKVDLIELIYALQSSGVVNRGNVSINEIASICEQMFNVSLGDYYRTFLEIRSRKINQTKFIDKLKESLLVKMENADE